MKPFTRRETSSRFATDTRPCNMFKSDERLMCNFLLYCDALSFSRAQVLRQKTTNLLRFILLKTAENHKIQYFYNLVIIINTTFALITLLFRNEYATASEIIVSFYLHCPSGKETCVGNGG